MSNKFISLTQALPRYSFITSLVPLWTIIAPLVKILALPLRIYIDVHLTLEVGFSQIHLERDYFVFI